MACPALGNARGQPLHADEGASREDVLAAPLDNWFAVRESRDQHLSSSMSGSPRLAMPLKWDFESLRSMCSDEEVGCYVGGIRHAGRNWTYTE